MKRKITQNERRLLLGIVVLMLFSLWAWTQFGIKGLPAIFMTAGVTGAALTHWVYKRPQRETAYFILVASSATLIMEILLRIL